MTTTNRLKIKLVEETENMSIDLWNRGFQQIDNVCVGFINLGTNTVTFNEKREAIVELSTENPNNFVFIDILPENPQDAENWKAIARASIRCYQDTTDQKKLHLIAEGTKPDNAVTIQFIGWY